MLNVVEKPFVSQIYFMVWTKICPEHSTRNCQVPNVKCGEIFYLVYLFFRQFQIEIKMLSLHIIEEIC